jgi:xanthine dehydrogenase accessory factor
MLNSYAEHPQDVLAALLAWQAVGPVALVVVLATEGGGSRSPGTLMVVAADGQRVGYVSGGCLDADLTAQAIEALAEGRPRKLRYGAGSPFLDLPLPCGGAIDVMIVPEPDPDRVLACHGQLALRQPLRLGLDDCGQLHVNPAKVQPHVFSYRPKPRLRIAGRAAEAIGLDALSRASGFETVLQMPEKDFDGFAQKGSGYVPLQTPTNLPAAKDDPWTGVVLCFHDRDWEEPLLLQALQGPAFYIGAVGSSRTHSRRCERLRDLKVDPKQIARIVGPAGLIKSAREASSLACSILSEFVYHWTWPPIPSAT